ATTQSPAGPTAPTAPLPTPTVATPPGSTSSTTSSSSSSDSSDSSSSSPSTPGSSPPSPPSTYKIIELPLLTAAGDVTVDAINNQGTAVGTYLGVCGAMACTSQPQAWVYQQSSGALSELT